MGLIGLLPLNNDSTLLSAFLKTVEDSAVPSGDDELVLLLHSAEVELLRLGLELR